MNDITVNKNDHFVNELQSHITKGGPFSSWELFKMAYQAEESTAPSSFNGLRALDYLPHMNFLNHQTDCAKTVIEEMNGRAILADEVGLGKTIEAGLILKEYMIRGLAKKILILVPASLVNQWSRELNEKFYIPAVAHRKNYAWEQCDILISSIDKAKRSQHKETILNIDYDFLLIDEAHKLKNHKTKNYEFVRAIKKKYCLLLTATPVQNKLIEIFNLVSILRPGLLGDYDTFLKRFGKNRTNIKDDAYLKQLIQKVMVRNTRNETMMNETKRKIETIWVGFTEEEEDVYHSLEQSGFSHASFTRLTLLRELCSSREACYLTLKKMIDAENVGSNALDIVQKIEQLPQHVKGIRLIELIQSIGNEKIIVFTEYRATQVYLQWLLKQHNISSVPFRGGFKAGKKDWMRQLFENQVQVLIATEAGGEGINLQFCHHLINYDLPWNPMRLEQRIGRVHRFGQKNDVNIYNLAIRNTVEEHIMSLLYEKIHLFEKVIGNLDDILGELNITDIESEIKGIFNESSSVGEARIKLQNLSSIIKTTQESVERDGMQYGN